MDADALVALTVWGEARGEPADGKAAVALVIRNRTAQRYESDGTLEGTCLQPNQFDQYYYAYTKGRYRRVAHTREQALAQADRQLTAAQAQRALWSEIEEISLSVLLGRYYGGPEFEALGSKALLYADLDICSPPWATPDKLICKIGAHSFFHP